MTGAHRPVMLEAAVRYVCGAEGEEEGAGERPEGIRQGVFVDATAGRGGHTRRLLELLGPGSRVVAIDRDPSAVAAVWELAREDDRLSVCHGNFAELDALLDALGIGRVQGVLMDLGVSSPQLDDPDRGFSFLHDAPLDMRMDTSGGITAAEWLNTADEQDIARVLKEYGEERYARRIAAAIVAARPLATTSELAALVRQAQPRSTPGKHEATRVFQAVRIQINGELDALDAGLEAAFERLAGGGRLAVISFHSLEDRRVKHYFRSLTSPPALPRRLPVRDVSVQARARSIVSRACDATEVADNPRARSARLRVVEKLA